MIPSRSNRRPCEFIASIYFSVCVCSVYLGSKSPAAGNVAVCQNLLVGVWGRDYEGWETYIHTKQDRGKDVGRKHLQTAGVFSSPSLLPFCSPATLSERLYPKCLNVPCVHTFLALVALGLQRQHPWWRQCHALPVELCGTTHFFPPH